MAGIKGTLAQGRKIKNLICYHVLPVNIELIQLIATKLGQIHACKPAATTASKNRHLGIHIGCCIAHYSQNLGLANHR